MLAFPDDQGEARARLILERDASTDPPWPYGHETRRTAAWLGCNPSRASHLQDDPTCGRIVHHSLRAGCPRSLVGNVWPWRSPYPDDLWAAIAAGLVTDEMLQANLDALAMISAQADIHVVAFGVEPLRRFPVAVRRAVEAFSLEGSVPLYCLGVAGDGKAPLHPLARGKFAVRNDAELRPWSWLDEQHKWDAVFSDCRRSESGVWIADQARTG